MTTGERSRPHITVLYSCATCGISDRAVPVPARQEQDVVAWVRQTTYLLGYDHLQLSPDCPTEELKDVKIPIGGASQIGGEPQQ